jgi:hypothetical protein
LLKHIFRVLFARRTPLPQSSAEAILFNFALALAQEWGEHYLEPVQDRLRMTYPNLARSELSRINSIAQEAMKCGHDLVYSLAQKEGLDVSEATWRKAFLPQYPWVDEKNLGRLFCIGQYYAWK